MSQVTMPVLSSLINMVSQGRNEEIILEELREINNLLAEVDLSYNNEMILDKIFSKFCIGK